MRRFTPNRRSAWLTARRASIALISSVLISFALISPAFSDWLSFPGRFHGFDDFEMIAIEPASRAGLRIENPIPDARRFFTDQHQFFAGSDLLDDRASFIGIAHQGGFLDDGGERGGRLRLTVSLIVLFIRSGTSDDVESDLFD